jgi:hypothetical protein
MIEMEIWVAYGEDGSCESDPDKDTAIERFNDNIGGDMWLVCLKVKAPMPKWPVVEVEVPESKVQATAEAE